MERSNLALLVGVVVVVAAAGVGAAFVFGVVPGDDGGTDAAPPTNDESNESGPSLTFAIEGRSECGLTCRRVNSTITNTGNASLNVSVAHALFTRHENGTADEQVWTGQAEPGSIPSESAVSSQFEIEVSLGAGQRLQENGGILYSTMVTAEGNETVENVVLDD
ncbi:hypothetical protein [Halorientalis halophila]|uniref:hypothetical protein n=1 Tax=Halorientalis halophila TaxID=3108499 RepID=UPI00300A03C1